MLSRDLLKRALPVVVTGASLVYLFSGIDVGSVIASLGAESAMILIPATVIFCVVTLSLEGLSLGILTAPTGAQATALLCARIKAASYIAGMLNYALGIAALSLLFKRRVGMSLTAAAGMVATVSVTDAAMLLSVTTVAAAFYSGQSPALGFGAVVLVTSGAAVGLVFLRFPGSLGPLDRIREVDLFRTVRQAPLGLLARLAVLRLCFVFAFVSMGGAALAAFGVFPPFGAIIVGMAGIALVGALPIAVAGLGTVQLATVELFGSYSNEANLVACSLSLQAAMLVMRMSVGAAFAREFTREAVEVARGEQT
jgi:hypothetical protein